MNSAQEKAARKELQGPRPAPLKVSRESHQVRKPPLPIQYRPPVIIYAHSPKIIHTQAGEFMTLVQRLTGRSASNPDLNSHPPPLPPPDLNIQPPPMAAAEASASQVFEASYNPQADNFRVSSSNPPPFSVPVKESEKFTRNISPTSPNIPGGLFSPLSPNFFIPSPRFLSPSLFQGSPLFTPQIQSDFSDHFFSPRHVFQKQSELLFTPSSIRPSMNMNAFWSPSPTGYDLFNHRP
ncbi:hypothetical protein SUGI_0227160 [Cryptomeria japonica]|uniref:protein MKS1 n=1 Tax=Cryptomeria japonica TaxID=3369 RepID=UPI002408E894|nr:protein MKS1 [Cryptomeria japonica]GLJ14155.1 hypothetical protein SUGI_0227160 [Cryptomeria japonica]